MLHPLIYTTMKIQIQFRYIERDLKTQKNRIGYQMQAFDAIQYTSFTIKNLC